MPSQGREFIGQDAGRTGERIGHCLMFTTITENRDHFNVHFTEEETEVIELVKVIWLKVVELEFEPWVFCLLKEIAPAFPSNIPTFPAF